jgi:hypothetical protein
MLLSLFDSIRSYFWRKSTHHDAIIELAKEYRKTIQQVNRKHPVASQHMYITESVSTVASRRGSESRQHDKYIYRVIRNWGGAQP